MEQLVNNVYSVEQYFVLVIAALFCFFYIKYPFQKEADFFLPSIILFICFTILDFNTKSKIIPFNSLSFNVINVTIIFSYILTCWFYLKKKVKTQISQLSFLGLNLLYFDICFSHLLNINAYFQIIFAFLTLFYLFKGEKKELKMIGSYICYVGISCFFCNLFAEIYRHNFQIQNYINIAEPFVFFFPLIFLFLESKIIKSITWLIFVISTIIAISSVYFFGIHHHPSESEFFTYLMMIIGGILFFIDIFMSEKIENLLLSIAFLFHASKFIYNATTIWVKFTFNDFLYSKISVLDLIQPLLSIFENFIYFICIFLLFSNMRMVKNNKKQTLNLL